MAKFLPFVVEKSAPEYIFQTLITRSKGVNNLLISSIFNLIMGIGISKVREKAKELPDDLPLTKVYEELMIAFPTYKISNAIYQDFQSVSNEIHVHHQDELDKEMQEYSAEDIMIFLMVMHLQKPDQSFISISFKPLTDGSAEHLLTHLAEAKLFANGEEELYFTCKEDLHSYILYNGLLQKDGVRTVTAILDPITPDKKSSEWERTHETP